MSRFHSRRKRYPIYTPVLLLPFLHDVQSILRTFTVLWVEMMTRAPLTWSPWSLTLGFPDTWFGSNGSNVNLCIDSIARQSVDSMQARVAGNLLESIERVKEVGGQANRPSFSALISTSSPKELACKSKSDFLKNGAATIVLCTLYSSINLTHPLPYNRYSTTLLSFFVEFSSYILFMHSFRRIFWVSDRVPNESV